MIGLSVALLIVYILLVIILIVGWVGIDSPSPDCAEVFTSVVIPVRNEEQTIQNTVRSILQNDYPADQFEILIVNDHSDDQTGAIVKNIKDSRVRMLNLPEGKEGKKQALTLGVSEAKGDLILCTDGDTKVQSNWIKSHVLSFVSGAHLSFGPVQYAARGLLSRVLNTELSALVMIGGATVGLGSPTMINGCNYSFSKEAFGLVKGFEGNENLPTGDDEFLLRKIHQSKIGSVAFLKSKEALVTTEPVANLSTLIQQRRRWASKWKHHKDWASRVLPIFVFVFYALFMLSMIWAAKESLVLGLILIGSKLLADGVLWLPYLRVIGRKPDWGAMLLLQIIYPFYVLFLGLASNFGQYAWKGRRHHI
jgi:biofilm PGA synthesis N-glycosyltransferase PgaC